MNELFIKKASIKDIDSLNILQLAPKLHLERLEKQNKNNGYYLLALINKKEIGHLFIDFKSDYSWHKYPVIMDLHVREDERRKGFAQKMMEFAESVIKNRGFSKACLDVGIDNFSAKRLYEKLGYKTASGPHNLTWIEKDYNEKKVTEKVIHLCKNI